MTLEYISDFDAEMLRGVAKTLHRGAAPALQRREFAQSAFTVDASQEISFPNENVAGGRSHASCGVVGSLGSKTSTGKEKGARTGSVSSVHVGFWHAGRVEAVLGDSAVQVPGGFHQDFDLPGPPSSPPSPPLLTLPSAPTNRPTPLLYLPFPLTPLSPLYSRSCAADPAPPPPSSLLSPCPRLHWYAQVLSPYSPDSSWFPTSPSPPHSHSPGPCEAPPLLTPPLPSRATLSLKWRGGLN